MDLETAEWEIAAFYRHFAAEAPGVTPVETGYLGQLWAFVDLELSG